MSCKLDLFLNKQLIYKAFSGLFALGFCFFFLIQVINNSSLLDVYASDKGLLTDHWLELFLPSGFDLNHALMNERNIFKDKRMVDAIFLV